MAVISSIRSRGISAWILEKKSIQYSTKKSAWFQKEDNMPAVRLESNTVTHHTPSKIDAVKSNYIDNLKR